MATVRLRDPNTSTDSSPTSAATSLPLSAPLPLPPELTQNSKFGFAFPDAPNQTTLPLIPQPTPAEEPKQDGEPRAEEDTLLQLSPHVLDPAKEQFSGCTLQLPTTSIGGMLHAMKGLNWMSIRLAGFVESEPNGSLNSTLDEPRDDTFDVGEMLQSVGDLLGGIAAQAGIDVVIYHADVGLKHVGVKGDEGGAAYALSHVNCIFEIAHRMNTALDSRIPLQLDTVILRRLLTYIHATLQIKPSTVPPSPSLLATPDTPTTSITHTAMTQGYTLTTPLIAHSPPLSPLSLTPTEQAEWQPSDAQARQRTDT
ncbi:osomolarity two-component system, response regulator SSK1 [Rhizoctonia solani]|uniref:Osomolarity two-component system, response regulator SSK1 n=1 Tax=Rhizoctonia solani TaxID=456999 RepID=A0A0K6GFX0_9AGAM|nr:osomolarity two-component system, response regulator SSK1 [Rhizoctonia solani]